MPRLGWKRRRVAAGSDTTLEKKNGGKFPAERVYEIVQETWIGTNIHRRMPVMGFDVRSRSSTIVNYLRRIQEK